MVEGLANSGETFMNTITKAPGAQERSYSEPTEADQVRALLTLAGLSQRAGARELEINERTMRAYCAGDKVPRAIILALERLVDLQRQIAK
jgi:DNA-binding transcriptional regulator YiaG